MKTKILCLLLIFLLAVGAVPQAVQAETDDGRREKELPADYSLQVRKAMSDLSLHYQRKNLRSFMNLVSPGFLGDDFMLDRALRRDFRDFENISLRFAVNSVNIDTRGRAQVYVHYNRSIVAQKDGRTYSDHGVTQFTFHLYDGKVKLLDMKYPIIFGVSQASLLATGEVRDAENADILAVNRRGEVSVLPYNEAKTAAEQSGVRRGINIRLRSSMVGPYYEGWSFADNRRTQADNLAHFDGDMLFEGGWLKLPAGTIYRDLGSGDLSTVTAAPDPAVVSYDTTGWIEVSACVNKVLALKLRNGKFALIKIVSHTWDFDMYFDYKYQPSGSRSF